MAVVADLVINKPLGWSPPGIEFKRAHLYDINPVGVGAMGLASALSIAAHMGLMGDTGAVLHCSRCGGVGLWWRLPSPQPSPRGRGGHAGMHSRRLRCDFTPALRDLRA
jgi:hypothetical protein